MTPEFNHENNFWNRVDKSGGPDACWNWCGYVESTGYGYMRFRGKKIGTHVYAWQITNGRSRRAGYDICHTCIQNRKCCNPAHLYEGTRSQNIRDAINAGTFIPFGGKPAQARHGSHNPASVLSEQNVLEIYQRALAKEEYQSIAKDYGCSKCTIRAIMKGRTWAWLTGVK